MVVLMDVVAKVAPEVALVKCSAEDAVWVAECMYKHDVPSDVMARAVKVAGSVAELKAYIIYATEKFAATNPAVWGGSLATKIAAVAM